jgi:predicted DNA-binding transcriptional regulator AlpA
LGIRAVMTRYGGISDRTVDRWLEKLDFPKPIYIQRRRYWDEAELDAFDATRR